jgi:hypothetical protein
VVPSQEWLHQLPHKARQLEGRLYGAASSLEQYLDRSTLKNRLRIIANRITMQFIDQPTKGPEKSNRRSLSKLAQNHERRQSATRESIFSISSSIDTTASINVALRNKASFLGDGARHERKLSQSGLSQQIGEFQDSQSYNVEEGNHPSGHPSVIIVTRNENKSSPLVHSVDGSDSLSGTHECTHSGNGSLNMRRMPQDGSTGGKDDNISSLTSLQQQLLMQLKQQPHNVGHSPSTQGGHPLGIIGREAAASVGMNSAPGLLNQVKSYDRAQHSLASKTELERQKAVNAQLQEQIMANIRLHEDMVRRLQKGQTVPIQQQQQLAELQGRQMTLNSIHSPTSTGLLQQMPNPATASNNNLQIGSSPSTNGSNIQVSTSMTTQHIQNTLLMQQNNQNKHINAGTIPFSAETVMSNNTAQTRPLQNGSMLGSSIGIGNSNNNNNQMSMFSMNQMSQMGDGNHHLNRTLPGVQGLNNSSFHGVGSLQGNVTSNGMQRPNAQVSEMSTQIVQNSSNTGNPSSMDFQALYNAQQRALGQQIGNSNSSSMFGNDLVLQQQQQQIQQIQQLQMLRSLGNRQSTGLAFNNNQVNRNVPTPMQNAFQHQQQQLFNMSGSLPNFKMANPNVVNGSMQNSDHGINPMMGMVDTTGNGNMGFMGIGLGGFNNNSISNSMQQMENGMMNGFESHRNTFNNIQNTSMNINSVSNDDSNLEAGVAPLSPRSFAW